MNNKKIKIVKNGPYLVSGDIPLSEMNIQINSLGNYYEKIRDIPVEGQYALCRCGRSKNMPFCDGTHHSVDFDGTLTASREPFKDQIKTFEGKNLLLEDAEPLCAIARFCHAGNEDVWTLVENSVDKNDEILAIKLATDCPSGRLVMVDKLTNQPIEPSFEPSIVVLQDPEKNCSGPLWVRGYVKVEDENGAPFEKRNRVTLCRCGKSQNKPFCDGTHIDIGFTDK